MENEGTVTISLKEYERIRDIENNFDNLQQKYNDIENIIVNCKLDKEIIVCYVDEYRKIKKLHNTNVKCIIECKEEIKNKIEKENKDYLRNKENELYSKIDSEYYRKEIELLREIRGLKDKLNQSNKELNNIKTLFGFIKYKLIDVWK